jgi:hypothetical protein
MASIISAGTSTGTALNLTGDTSGILQLASNNGTVGLTMDTSQNVGIGTSSPQGRLAISAAGAQGLEFLTLSATAMGIQSYNRSTSAYIDQNYVGSTYTWTTGGVGERMRIDSSGNVLVGTTTNAIISGFSLQGLGINGSFTATGGLAINSTSSTGTQYFIGFGRGGSFCGNINSPSTNTTAYATSSDYRLKDNVEPMVGALNTIAQLKPVTYKWKSDNSDGQGFIAHELQEVVPDCVFGEKDAVDTEGNPQYQTVDTSFLVATLTAAIQEQQALITQLQADVAALKGAK